ncbi:tetratricopeptide repeat protein [uncultured Mucilaginibacter sp.]|uniref:tetratricopeptide repeat protein n=1 Tax=uncultured Mucilaginibacter sp. TaxID=797541 RepID=UPI0025E65C0B|nr:tetratricopeptide repeat protein [uncultured Mucilaginibacter sp.]
MKKIYFTILAIVSILSAGFAQNIDSLQRKQDSVQHICAQAELYINTADSLIQFGQQKTRVISMSDAAKASDCVLKAIQTDKKFNDTLAIRNDFDRLGQAYVLQNKFTEAKWYILQSACISRDARDVPHIISSLLELAAVKTVIKDYDLAQKDLQEAIVLCKYEYNVPQQIVAEKQLAALYDQTGKLKEANSMVAHYTLLAEGLRKANAPRYMAMQKVKIRTKKPASADVKQGATLADVEVMTPLN